MKRLIAAMLVLVGSVLPAHAVTITSGHIGAWQGGDFGGYYNIQGEGYALVSFTHGGNEPVDFRQYTQGGLYGVPRDFSGPVTLRFGPLTGELNWTVEPVTVPRDLPLGVNRVGYVQAPFSMTGVINGVPLDGVGVFELGAYAFDTGWATWAVNFDFASPGPLAETPEPMTLLLMGAGLFLLGWHERRRWR